MNRAGALAWRVVRLAVAGTAVWVFAVPQLRHLPAAATALLHAPPALLALVVLCALAALLAYAQLTRTMLARGPRPGLLHTLGIITTSLGLSNVLPAGAAAGGVVAFRMLGRAGVGRARAGLAMAATSIGSTAVLLAMLAVGIAAQLMTRGGPIGLAAAVPSLVVLGIAAVAAHALRHRRELLWAPARRLDGRRLPLLRRWALVDGLEAAATVLDGWVEQPRLLARGLFWAVVNWVIDMVALWLTLRIVGISAGPVALLVAFSLANLAAMVPLTPGGIGLVELTLTATLVASGAPAAATAVGVAAYRVFNYWLPIPGSLLAYGSVRLYEQLRSRARPVAVAGGGG